MAKEKQQVDIFGKLKLPTKHRLQFSCFFNCIVIILLRDPAGVEELLHLLSGVSGDRLPELVEPLHEIHVIHRVLLRSSPSARLSGPAAPPGPSASGYPPGR